PVRFSLKEQNRRIDVCGELIWTDEAQKIGGLRFTTLTNEAREHIDNWAVQPQDAAPESNRSRLGAAFLRVFPNLHVRQFVPRFASTNRLAPLRTQVRLRMSGFSGGLATGLLISILTSFIFVFSYVHRQQFGESLIRLGQRLAAKSEAAPQPAPAMVTRANVTQHVSSPNSGEVASVITRPISSAPFASSAASSSPNAPNIPAPREPIGQVHAQSPASGPALPLQRFFDLGKFKQQQVAQDLSERVAQLGMHASVVNKGH